MAFFPDTSDPSFLGAIDAGTGGGYSTMPMPMQATSPAYGASPQQQQAWQQYLMQQAQGSAPGYAQGFQAPQGYYPSGQGATYGGAPQSSGGSPTDWISQVLPQAAQIRGATAGDASYWESRMPDFQQRYGSGWQDEMYQRMLGKGAADPSSRPSGPFSAANGYSYQATPQDYGYSGGGMGMFGGGPSYNGPALAMPGGLSVGSLATPGAFQAPEGPLGAAQNINPGQFNYQGLQAPSNFQLPTGQQALDQDPGYQFRLQQGLDALQNSAASRGALRDPNTDRAIVDYGQGAASQEYGNAYNRALQTYQTNTGTNLAAQQQQYQQGLGAFQTNASTGLQANNQNFQNQLAQYQANFQNPLAAYQATNQAQQGAFNANANAQIGAYSAQNQAQLGAYNANVNAQLGYGNLGLGYGNLGLQSQLGLGNLGVSQGYLGLAGDQQAFNQPYQLAQLGSQNAQSQANTGLGYYQALTGLYGQNANAMGNLYTGQGNANAAGQVASGNAWQTGLGNLGNLGLGLGAYAGNFGQQPPPQAPQPPTGLGHW